MGAIRTMFRFAVRTIGRCIEPLAIVFVCYLFAGSPTPAVNEAHYLAKAKHYWQPEWCANDFFLESADAHEVFYWTFGWVTQHHSLPATAWIGRAVVWMLFAGAWCHLLRTLTTMRGAGLLSAIILLPLTYYGHLAGEWLIGGIEAKGFAYPLVLLAIARASQNKWWQAWPLLGLASSFHILVGGWMVIACLFAWWIRRKEDQLYFRDLLIWLPIGGLLALPGLIPAIQLTAAATAEEIQEANITYTFRRLSHHLVPYRFAQWNPFAPGFTVLRPASFALVCFLWWQLGNSVRSPRWQRIRQMVHGTLVIAAAGLAIEIVFSPFDHFQISPFNHVRSSLLRFYWFRMSDVMVPMGLAMLAVLRLQSAPAPDCAVWKRPIWQLVVVLLLAFVGFARLIPQQGFTARGRSLQQQNWRGALASIAPSRIDDGWQDACDWFRNRTDSNVVVLTPVGQQTFKWLAHRPDVVTWKDVPQDAPGIVAWWERRRQVHKLRDWPWRNPEQLSLVIDMYDVTHIVWPDLDSKPHGPHVRETYHNDLFRIFEVLPADAG